MEARKHRRPVSSSDSSSSSVSKDTSSEELDALFRRYFSVGIDGHWYGDGSSFQSFLASESDYSLFLRFSPTVKDFQFEHYLYVVGGDKGGVGKTFLTTSVASLWDRLGVEYLLVDAQRGQDSILRKLHRNYAHIYFSEDVSQSEFSDRLLDFVLGHRVVLLNMPADSSRAWEVWFKDVGFDSILRDFRTCLFYWYPTDGSVESLSCISSLVNAHPYGFNHIFLNHHFTRNWDRFVRDLDGLIAKDCSFVGIHRFNSLPSYIVSLLESGNESLGMLVDTSHKMAVKYRLLRYFDSLRSSIYFAGGHPLYALR